MTKEAQTIDEQMLGKYVLTRSRAGIFAGVLKSKEGNEIILENSRRLRYWKGAATLSELSQKGPACPDECEFPAEVPTEWLDDIFEMLVCSPEAEKALKEVKIWTAHNQ